MLPPGCANRDLWYRLHSLIMAETVLDGPWDKVIQGLEDVDNLFLPLISRAVGISLEAVKEAITPTPAQPSRTRSKHFNTYVRLQGSFPKSAFVASAGTPGGFKIKGKQKLLKQGRVRLTSQQSEVEKSFKTSVTPSEGGVEGHLINEATYSGWVFGPLGSGKPHQVGFHGETGWVNSDAALQKAMPQIKDSINMAMKQLTKQIVEGG